MVQNPSLYGKRDVFCFTLMILIEKMDVFPENKSNYLEPLINLALLEKQSGYIKKAMRSNRVGEYSSK